MGNNPDRQNIYSAALGLYNSRIVKLVNKKGQLEKLHHHRRAAHHLFRGIDNLIATARSNKVAVCLGFQDFSQLARDYGDKGGEGHPEHGGQHLQRTGGRRDGKSLSERFGKILQQRHPPLHQPAGHLDIHQHADGFPDTRLQDSHLSQGTFVGSVADNFRGEEIDQKIFHARIIVDSAKCIGRDESLKKIPVINEFRDADGNDIMQQQIDRNYSQIKADVLQIIEGRNGKNKK